GDRGEIESESFKGKVVDTKKPFPNFIVHHVEVKKGTVWVGDKINLIVDKTFRAGAESHHTSTHVLHAVLKEILGDHVNQAGSLVTPERLRFDFSHYSAIEDKDLKKIEDLMNERVRMDDTVKIQKDVPYDEAIGGGATAIFEEKYGDKVRVVSIGDYSKELCGGTHLHSAGEAGLIKIINETASAAGVRRIEAITSDSAINYLKDYDKIISKTESVLNVSESVLIKNLKSIVEENDNLNRELRKIKNRSLGSTAESYFENIKEIDGLKLLVQEIPGASASDLRTVWDSLRQKIKSGVTVLASKNSEKVFLLVGVTKDLAGEYHAGHIIKELAEIVGGRGGGKSDLAQAGGTIPEKLDEALSKSVEVIQKSSK
ncbi:MAG: DHHA1 domain-containing protein, partial [Thermodesulfobacteriota bacterium]